MLSTAEENYLKAIYKIEMEKGEPVSTGALAQAFGIQAPSVTDMVKKLALKKLLRYEKSKGVKLTDTGFGSAIAIVRKHRIWESFLVQTLGFGWEEVHELAEQLEHVNSEKLTDRLESFLGFPRFDPHGDPIPDKHGNVANNPTLSLANAEFTKEYVVVGISDDSAELLLYLNRIGIGLGAAIRVENQEPYDHSLQIVVNKNAKIGISALVADALLVAER